MAITKILRDPVSSITHIVGALASVIGLGVMLFFSLGGLARNLVLVVYGVSLILMFSASAIYHAVLAKPQVILLLRKFDHTAIYLQIAGTYTAVCYQYLSGGWRFGILFTIWLMAVAGIIVKFFFINAPRWVSAGIYLIMGWTALVAIRQILSAMPAVALAWLLAGGILYTVGAVVYITKKPDPWPKVFGFHEIWHIFVLLGAFAHFILVAFFVAMNQPF